MMDSFVRRTHQQVLRVLLGHVWEKTEKTEYTIGEMVEIACLDRNQSQVPELFKQSRNERQEQTLEMGET